MENLTFNFVNSFEHGPAFRDFLRLRKRFFVDNLGWDIPHDDSVEMDQYDNPKAYYSLVIMDGEIVGGARVMPTTARWGTHTYMLRDAFEGKLIDIPASVLTEEITSPAVWECTRLVISDCLTTHRERSMCLSMILDGMIETVASQDGDRIMSLSPLAMMRTLRQLGYAADRVGDPYHNVGDGRRYAVLTMPAARTLRHIPTATHRPQPQPVHAPAIA